MIRPMRKDQIFVCSKEDFPNHPRGFHWVNWTSSPITSSGADKPVSVRDIICDDEYIYQDLEELKKFKDSKILVVAAGPSTKEVEWNHDDYDYVFSCNHCFKMDKFKEKGVAVYFLGNEVNPRTEEFIKYFHKHNEALIAIEDIRDANKICELIKLFKGRVFACSSRWQAKFTGAGAKVLTFALCLEPREVHYVGLDGITKKSSFKKPMPHSFEKSKLFRKNKEQTYEEVLKQYQLLEKYLKESFPDSEIKNLGKTCKYNCLYEDV